MPAPKLPDRLRVALAAACVAVAVPAITHAKPPGDTIATGFEVRNALNTPLYGFRIREGDGQWKLIGDLAPGNSSFQAPIPRNLVVGTFEFQSPAQRATGDYTLGGFNAPRDGKVVIAIDPQPGIARCPACNPDVGSTLMTLPVANAWAGLPAPWGEASRLSLLAVPAADALRSGFMFCLSVDIGLSTLFCAGDSLSFIGSGKGLGMGLSYGWFSQAVSRSMLVNAFPVRAVQLQYALYPTLLRFYAHSDDMPDDRDLGHFVGIGVGAQANLTTSGGFTSAESAWPGPMLPPGSYQASCRSLDFDAGQHTLTGICQGPDGQAGSQLDLATCRGADVKNEQGALSCDLPAGSYRDSCSVMRYRDGVLQASCPRANPQHSLDTSLDIAHDCDAGSTVSNVDGVLRCDRAWQPPGPYRDSCSAIRYAGGVLHADCGGLDSRTLDARLDYARLCVPGSDVDFAPRYGGGGQLQCAEPR
jgi:hypothetical protein